MEAGIYCIINRFNNKRYVGQGSNLYSRISAQKGNLNLGKHTNKLLQKDFNRYRKYFDLYIIEKFDADIPNLAKVLDEKEIFWIKELGTFLFGYNQNKGGRSTFGKNKRKFLWRNLLSNEVLEASCSEIAIKTKGVTSSFCKLARSKSKFYKNWVLDSNYNLILPFWNATRGRQVCVKNTVTGEVVLNVKPIDLPKKFGALRADVYNLVNGKTLSVKGWRMISEDGKFLKRGKKLSKIILTAQNTQTNELVENMNLCIFAEKYKLNRKHLSTYLSLGKTLILGWEILGFKKLDSHWDA